MGNYCCGGEASVAVPQRHLDVTGVGKLAKRYWHGHLVQFRCLGLETKTSTYCDCLKQWIDYNPLEILICPNMVKERGSRTGKTN